ncbi:molybdate ABC transporter substrate-binding protein [uncultured Amnibacterium sp.]|uniref:molybdate ABC transporter substrate-binding protein n=1 Tax=uncultured Amnibacterium sp. TaxID=1631851 RepID=UPI0035CAEF9B
MSRSQLQARFPAHLLTRSRARGVAALITAGSAAVLLAGCSSTPSTPASSAVPQSAAARTPAADNGLTGSITVDAAASLNGVYPTLADSFTAANPGTKIAFNFGGSDSLAAAIVSGAPVDVFSSASTKTMQTVIDAKLTAATPVVVARNQLEIAVPKGNPGKITGLADFADADKTIVICAPTVPCGAAAQTVFAAANVTAKPDSTEQDVTSVLNKVKLGDAQAGLVYRTDVQAAGGAVKGIQFPESSQAIQSYPIAPLTGSKNPTLAAAFVRYVQQQESVLQAAGFLTPQ